MNDDEQARWQAAARDFWVALSGLDPGDRPIVVIILALGLVVGIHEGLGLFAPFYAIALTLCGVAMFWAIRSLARSKIDVRPQSTGEGGTP